MSCQLVLIFLQCTFNLFDRFFQNESKLLDARKILEV